MFKEVARIHGISVSEVREQMQIAIEEAMNNPDTEKQAEFQRLFGHRHQRNLSALPARNYLSKLRECGDYEAIGKRKRRIFISVWTA